MRLFNFVGRLLESYLLVLALALIAGLFWTDKTILLAPFTTLFLQAIFFGSGLKINIGKIRDELRRPWRPLLASALMLIIFPLVAYPIARFFSPEIAVGIMLLAAMPAGMTVPLFSALAGGSETTALVLTVLTSALAPFTIPLVAKLTVGSGIKVDTLGMFWNLVVAIILPLVLAQIVRQLLKTKTKLDSWRTKPLSILLLGLLIAAVVAKNAAAIRGSFGSLFFPILVGLCVFFIITHFVGYFTAFSRPAPERISYMIALSYMNFVMAIYLAETYFASPTTVLTTVLALVPWTLMFVPVRSWAFSKSQ